MTYGLNKNYLVCCYDSNNSFVEIGKTNIFNTLAQFLVGDSMDPYEYIEYSANKNNFHIIPSAEHRDSGYHRRTLFGTQEYEDIYWKHLNYEEAMIDVNGLRYYGVVYLKAKSCRNIGLVKSVTTIQLDSEKCDDDSHEDYTYINQLWADVSQKDDASRSRESSNGAFGWKIDWFMTYHSKEVRFAKGLNSFSMR